MVYQKIDVYCNMNKLWAILGNRRTVYVTFWLAALVVRIPVTQSNIAHLYFLNFTKAR